MEELFIFAFDLLRESFVFLYDTYTSITVFGNASMFDLIIAIIVVGAIPTVIISAFGGVGLATGIGSAVSGGGAIQHRKSRESREHYNSKKG